MKITGREAGALIVLASIGTITAVWWALALWPLPDDAPNWLVRTRVVCFGSSYNGLPTTAGWLALIGQPAYMLATLWLLSGRTVVRGLRALAVLPAGRMTLGVAIALTVVGLGAAGIRVARAAGPNDMAAAPPLVPAAAVPRLHKPAPALGLIDQHGKRIEVAQFRGRPVLVSFAFAHCETVCPLIVNDLRDAQAEVAELRPVVLIVTLDPWRDPPARLPAIATQWRLGTEGHVLSGTVAEVERTLDEWQVGRTREGRTGALTHAAVVYVLDRTGEIAFRFAGGTSGDFLATLLRRL